MYVCNAALDRVHAQLYSQMDMFCWYKYLVGVLLCKQQTDIHEKIKSCFSV